MMTASLVITLLALGMVLASIAAILGKIDQLEDARRSSELKHAAEHAGPAINSLKAVFTIWQAEAKQLNAMALELGVSRHRMFLECSLLAVASLEDAVIRSVLERKQVIRAQLAEALLSQSDLTADTLATLREYRAAMTNACDNPLVLGLALGHILARRTGMPNANAVELGSRIHAILMRAGLAALDELR